MIENTGVFNRVNQGILIERMADMDILKTAIKSTYNFLSRSTTNK